MVKIRKALVKDVPNIHRIINEFAKANSMLPRSLNDLYDNIRDMFVAEDQGALIAVCGMHVLWDDLAEVRSLAVSKDHQGEGIGKALVRRSIKDAKTLGIKRVFALTYVPDYFRSAFGFRVIEKSDLPHKIWGECLHCPKFPDCDEVAVIKEI